jgi:hypothetical protein
VLIQCILAIGSVSATSFKARCDAFGKSIQIPNVTVAFTDFVPNGTNITFPNSVGQLKDYHSRLRRLLTISRNHLAAERPKSSTAETYAASALT